MRDDVSIRLLGPVEVFLRGRPVTGLSPQSRSLLAALALSVGNVVDIDHLVDVLWPTDPPATARKSIQKRASEIRRRLGHDLLETASAGYRLVLNPERVDSARFGALLAGAGASSDDVTKREMLEGALALWVGEPLGGTGPGFEPWRTRLGELHLSTVESRMRLRLQQEDAAAVVGELEELVGLYPLRERLWGLLMTALYRSGRQADALRAYRRIRQILGEQLGIEPSPELRRLEDQILTQDPTLAGTPQRSRTFGNLPKQLTSFVGRSSELEELTGLLATAPLVTLTGPGGSGKTRLAVEWASRVRDRFPDGCWIVDLAPLNAGDQIALSMVQQLGLAGRSSLSAEAALLDYLASRRALIVLDNCEHLVEAAAELTHQLLLQAEHLRILATSRQPLDLAGERIYDVEPLGVPDRDATDPGGYESVRLFVDRAQSIVRHFELTPSNASAVAEICRKLDGMPLAIELAAARIRTFDAAHLAGLLDDRFAILVSAARHLTRRHQTLRATVEWSHELLPQPHRVLFRRLSVFRGGCDLEAIEQVCGREPLTAGDVVSLLPELVDRSLVVAVRSPGRPTRYRLLETLRQFGEERLEPGEAAQLRRLHAEWFCGLIEDIKPELRGPGQMEAIERLGADYDNIREALSWSFEHDAELAVRLAVALAEYWDTAGPRIVEAQTWISKAVEVAETVDARLRLACLIAASDLFVTTKLSSSESYARAALGEALALGDAASEARALRALAWARTLGEDVPAAIALGTRALEIFRELGDEWETALCLERIGQADFAHPEEALESLAESLDLYRRVGDQRRAAMVLYKMTERAMQAMTHLDEALQWARESATILDGMGSTQHSGHALLELGRITRRRGHPEHAGDILEDALARLRKVGDQRCTARALVALGTALTDVGETQQAAAALGEGLKTSVDLDERQVLRVAFASLGRLLVSEGLFEEATTVFASAEQLRSHLMISVAPTTQSQRQRRLDQIRAELGDETFAMAYERGEAMSPHETADLAASLIHALQGRPPDGSGGGLPLE